MKKNNENQNRDHTEILASRETRTAVPVVGLQTTRGTGWGGASRAGAESDIMRCSSHSSLESATG